MPALDIDFKSLEKKGFIKVLSGNEYLTVQGRLYLAHSSGQLLSINTDEMYPDDPDFLTIRATVDIFNPAILAQIERIAASDKISDETKSAVIGKLTYSGLVTTYTGMAQSKRRGGKSAEGTNPREVAETSAVGRALGNAGFGDTESFASLEEMLVAMSRDGSEAAPAPKSAGKKPAAKKSADPNKPSTEQKKELYDLAVEHLNVTNRDEFAEAIQASQGKALEVLTATEVANLIAELKGEQTPTTPPY